MTQSLSVKLIIEKTDTRLKTKISCLGTEATSVRHQGEQNTLSRAPTELTDAHVDCSK